ncbi:MAG: endonuclease VII domain-containing protein [Bdellovibrionales bacterium]
MNITPWKNRSRARLSRQYGIDDNEYYERYVLQGGRCKVCPSTSGYKERALAIDHCHATGTVRGLLCDRCNLAEGNLKPENHSLELKEYIRFSSLLIAHEQVEKSNLSMWDR